MLSLFRRSHNEVNKTSRPPNDLSHFYEDVDEMGAASSRDAFIQTYPQRRMTNPESCIIENKTILTKEKKMMRKNRTTSMPPPVQLAKVQKISDVPTPYEIRQMMEKRFENDDFQPEISSETDEETDKLQAKLNEIAESIHQVERRLSFNPQLTIPFTKQAQIHYKKRSSTLTENSNSSQETTPKSRAKFFRKKADNLSSSQSTLETENLVEKNPEKKRALTSQLSSSSEDSGIDRRLSLDGENDGEHGNGEKQKKKKSKSKSLVKKFTTRARSRSLGFLLGEKPQAPLFGTSYLNREWEIVTVKEMCRRLSLDEIDHIEMPIPEGAETSQVLDELMIRQVMEILPARAEGYPWVQIYNSEKHGFSLATLYRKMAEFDEDMSPVLLIIRDTNDHVFGAIVSSAIRPHEGYWGTGDSCLLWKFTGEVPHTRELRHFTWTGDNQFFVNAAKESLSIGAGGGHQGLWLDADLNHGRSQKCETFDNEPLAGDKEDFIIQFCEAFGFRM